MEMSDLTVEMVMVFALIALAIFLFIVEWVRVDVVAIIIMVTLPLVGLIEPEKAFVGLSSNAVVSIIAIIIIGSGLDKTGLVNKVVTPLVRISGEKPSRMVAVLSVTIATVSSFMQNIGAAALFLPAIRRACKASRIPIGRILMPVGFAAILGGTNTMVGSSPVIILNDLITPYGFEPFGLFAVTPVGIALVASGIFYFTVFQKWVLPHADKSGEPSAEERPDVAKSWYRFLGEPYELTVPQDYTPPNTVVTISDVRRRYTVNTVAVKRPGEREQILSPSSSGTELVPGMELGVYGTRENVETFAKDHGLTLKPRLHTFEEALSPAMSGTAEAVVSPHSHLVGKTLGEVHFRRQYGVSPMAIYRGGDQVFKSSLSQVPLQVGDAVMFHGSWSRFKILHHHPDFIFTTQIDVEVMRPEKAALAGIGFALALAMVLLLDMRISVCLMTGAVFMILTRVLTIDEAYEAVDWRTVFLLGGLIPLGIVTEQTGAAAWIARHTLTLMGDVTPLMLLVTIAFLSTGLTLVISNVGAAVLLVPLVVNMAMEVGADPRVAALTVAIAVSNSFVLPTHQVNALYMGPGRYRSVDFIRAGSVFSLVYIVVMILMINLVFDIG